MSEFSKAGGRLPQDADSHSERLRQTGDAIRHERAADAATGRRRRWWRFWDRDERRER